MDIKSFFTKYAQVKYERGERIIRPNELTSYVIFVKSGIFKIYKARNGRETIINIINAASYDGLLLGIDPHIKKIYNKCTYRSRSYQGSHRRFS